MATIFKIPFKTRARLRLHYVPKFTIFTVFHTELHADWSPSGRTPVHVTTVSNVTWWSVLRDDQQHVIIDALATVDDQQTRTTASLTY